MICVFYYLFKDILTLQIYLFTFRLNVRYNLRNMGLILILYNEIQEFDNIRVMRDVIGSKSGRKRVFYM